MSGLCIAKARYGATCGRPASFEDHDPGAHPPGCSPGGRPITRADGRGNACHYHPFMPAKPEPKPEPFTRADAEALIKALQQEFPPAPRPGDYVTKGAAGSDVRVSIDAKTSGELLGYITLAITKYPVGNGSVERNLASLTTEKATALRDWLTTALDFIAEQKES